MKLKTNSKKKAGKFIHMGRLSNTLLNNQWVKEEVNQEDTKRVLFLSPSDIYVRSFLYLLYTLIKLYYTKAMSDQALSLALD